MTEIIFAFTFTGMQDQIFKKTLKRFSSRYLHVALFAIGD